ncbi:MAG: hypothetical protein M1838_005991 [Thelocarpon superellum]|nr:MAG: hypothetical protein M1838_005991 [Thelocarpon superellum]
MTKEQVANYLSDLRSYQPPRPEEFRAPAGRNVSPITPANFAVPSRTNVTLQQAPAGHDAGDPAPLMENLNPIIHRRTHSAMSGHSYAPSIGGVSISSRPHRRIGSRNVSATSRTSSGTLRAMYVENEQRRREKEEVRAIREALHDLDMQQLHISAQEQAADLMWRHQNPGAPQAVPAPLFHRAQPKSTHHGRSQSAAPDVRPAHDYVPPHEDAENLPSEIVRDGDVFHDEILPIKPQSPTEWTSDPSREARAAAFDAVSKAHQLWDSPQKKAYLSLTNPPVLAPAARPRQSSGPRSRNVSSNSTKGLFRNPEDQIYEEPDEDLDLEATNLSEGRAVPRPAPGASRSPFDRSRRTQDAPSSIRQPSARSGPSTAHAQAQKQSRRPQDVANAPPAAVTDEGADLRSARSGREGAGAERMEVRGDDLRQATSVRVPHRGSTASVPNAKNPMNSSRRRAPEKRSTLPHSEDSALNRPPVPTINLPEDPPVPAINLPEDPPSHMRPPAIPTINEPKATSESGPPRSRNNPFARPPPHHFATAPASTTSSQFTRAAPRPTASCTQCQLPIAGRIVSAAGVRFHPECFICFKCGEGLECVAFYPEPENSRAERVDRIQARAHGEPVDEADGQTEAEDGHDGLRFYCHLDFHELYSPRCRSCKTPIEGEVIVACGGEWHAGHFFCAECGDPFDAVTPFVEKDGYAWCITCHTNRYSTKCKKCRKPVTDQVVMALAAEWHVECFRCLECGGDFDDGRYFLRGHEETPVCVKCEEKRLKA